MWYIFISFWNELNKLKILLAKIASECIHLPRIMCQLFSPKYSQHLLLLGK